MTDVVRGKQGLEALAQGEIAMTGTIEKWGAFACGLGERSGKRGFFVVWIHGLRPIISLAR
ncbi:MAG TPA: hypothetical protein VL361_15790 [Candidatus Limnocylindrales bacterium]|nr:hypothetical protein [Candidatus Limnocylindrales bacterium]